MPQRARTAALGLLGMAAAGCSLIPHYERPPTPVPSEYPRQDRAPAASQSAAPKPEAGPGEGAEVGTPGSTGAISSTGPAAEIGWRDIIAEPRLARLVELALAENRDLRAAALKVEQSQAQFRRTRSGLFPSVDLQVTGVRQRANNGFGAATSTAASLSVASTAYELDFFGRVRSSTEEALQQYLETDEARRSAQIALVAEVVTQYFSLREAEEQLALARDTLADVQESYRLNAIEFDVGEINELDLRTADGQVQSARVNVLTYERQTAQAFDQLMELVGVPELPADLPAATPFDQGPSLLADVPAGLPADLVERRPDILEAEHALLAANADIGVARAAFFPSISLTGSVGRSSTELSGLVGSTGARVWSFAPQLSLPLFSAGANRANLDAARVAKDIALANYERTIQGAFREVADALVAVSTYGDEIDTQRAAIDAQARRLELADVRYRQGEDSYLAVLSAQQDLYSVQQARLRAQFNRLSSQISLYRALGGGWQ